MRQLEHLLVIWRESIWVWLMRVMQTLKVKVRVLQGAQKRYLRAQPHPNDLGLEEYRGTNPDTFVR
jgi:hypothetical protein